MFRCLKIFICMLSYFHLIFFQFKFSFRRSIQFIFLRRREIRNFLNFSFLIRYSKIQFLLNFQYIYVLETFCCFPSQESLYRSIRIGPKFIIFGPGPRCSDIIQNQLIVPACPRFRFCAPKPVQLVLLDQDQYPITH